MTHPLVPYDEALVDEVAARMTLRRPNREALRILASRFDSVAGEPFEAVCDIATAVGKTYLAGGLIDYLAGSGVRHFLFVTPGRTILRKTVDNFTDGHPKSILPGMETRPVVITAENFNTGTTGAALRDDSVVKLFVFNVQSLLRPTDNMTRRTRRLQEWLGEDLYQYMKTRDDLVVIADEHHVYSAPGFSNAVRDLDAMATIGLTATPTAADEADVVYRYPLAYAIADKLVKTPVLVGRRDDATDVETRLRDGLLLLDAKQRTADEWAAVTGALRVNAVMFVVADTIDNANAVAEVLRKPGMFEDDYESRVLTVHSAAPDDALARLAAVEEPTSPVRVIVSVSMLKEGWDVKNIFVICSLRPSISDVLTEQTLGRGLRLPWGAYTGVELLDTVEVISHERYAELLRKADVLLEGLTESRAELVLTPLGAPDTLAVTPAGGASLADRLPSYKTPGSDGTLGAGMTPALWSSGDADLPGNTPGFVVASLEERSRQAERQAAATANPVRPLRDDVHIPKVTRTVVGQTFELSTVPESEFVELGRRLASASATTLTRKRLEVVEDLAGEYHVVPVDASGSFDASRPNLPYANAKRALRDAIHQLDFVTEGRASLNAADRLANAVITGAGGEELLSSYMSAAIDATRHILRGHYRSAPELVTTAVEDSVFAPVRVNSRLIELNRYGDFSPRVAYASWTSSLHALNWFDVKPERALANLMDDDDEVILWSRIQRGELTIEWEDGRYSPDFYAETGTLKYLLEVKADKDVDTPLVQAKKAAAERWSRYVTDNGEAGTWRYVLVPESVLDVAKSFAAVIQQSAYG